MNAATLQFFLTKVNCSNNSQAGIGADICRIPIWHVGHMLMPSKNIFQNVKKLE
jgi:hypothetical protein